MNEWMGEGYENEWDIEKGSMMVMIIMLEKSWMNEHTHRHRYTYDKNGGSISFSLSYIQIFIHKIFFLQLTSVCVCLYNLHVCACLYSDWTEVCTLQNRSTKTERKWTENQQVNNNHSGLLAVYLYIVNVYGLHVNLKVIMKDQKKN